MANANTILVVCFMDAAKTNVKAASTRVAGDFVDVKKLKGEIIDE